MIKLNYSQATLDEYFARLTKEVTSKNSGIEINILDLDNEGKIKRYYKKSILGRLKTASEINNKKSKEIVKFYKYLIEFDINSKSYLNLKTLLVGTPSELKKAVKFILKNFNTIKFKSVSNNKKLDDNERILEIFNYENIRKYHGVFLLKQLNIKVCPYCGANNILIIERENNKLKALCQFDHFLSQSEYPYLSASIHNLVPSCSSCNHTKLDNPRKIVNPYENSLHDSFIFKVDTKSELDFILSGYKKDNLLEIQMTPKINNDTSQEGIITNHDAVFGTKSLYQHHTDIVAELYWKAHVYSKKYRTELKTLTNNLEKKHTLKLGKYIDELQHLNLTDKEIKRFIIGNYIEEKDFLKRPLSKLTHDIAKELGLLD
ncbi:hypothetical protein WAF17_18935 [Bernardetia sp. ABR2-2B]|uniref:hypothetical protein n=1 Tax=Bernardetia sp. ABR2-2B TaxID=3127472 RepID=UPI0030D52D0C